MNCNSKMTSTHAEDFHPSARLKPVRKAVCCCSENLPEEDQINIDHGGQPKGSQWPDDKVEK